MDQFLALSGLMFWTVAVGTFLVFVAIMALVEFNRQVWATGFFVASLYGASAFLGIPILKLVWDNPLATAYTFLLYLLIGGVWSIVKWKLYCGKIVKMWREGSKEYTSYLRILEAIKSSPDEASIQLPSDIDPSRNKDRLFGYVFYWPFSLVWTIFDNPLRALFDFLYDQFGMIYTTIAKRVARKIAATI